MPTGTAETILKNADAARTLLATQENALQRAINEFDDIEWLRTLTTDERNQRQKLRAGQTAVRAAQIELSFVTLRALDQTPEVQRLINAFKTINKDLKQQLERLKSIAEIAQTVARVVDVITKIAADLAKLLA